MKKSRVFVAAGVALLAAGVLAACGYVIMILPYGLFFVSKDLRQSVVVSIERELILSHLLVNNFH